ncbi:heptaprenylglyceryl phosphate synthase [Microaerobacter geothermalis]|uniref:heptaprenylglyceryl phosphate synthase n=1 Tax=Microaerobacter geothermalis TaxID=674972 RepID=UPI001F1AA363|nr:heptaprenylglyceryl phosphate synthase [Microaerobacter geothermalis]MCF6094473.1 heptaprenylglyceryl phosphate synthase [Microaerobacter geothermalis]
MLEEIKGWRHVFKLDPDKEISDIRLQKICESGTDAILVGGTQGIDYDNTVELLSRVRRYPIPCALEVSSMEAICAGFDLYFIPIVLNATDPEWILKPHREGLKRFWPFIDWNQVAVEGYVVLNPESSVARLTKTEGNLQDGDVLSYARMAEHMLHLPIFYLEYSGKWGDPLLVKKVKNVLKNTQLFYGGGIFSPEQAKEMANWADTVVVGNAVYESFETALKTVKAVKVHTE